MTAKAAALAAMARGSADAVDLFRAARAAVPNDAELALGEAEAEFAAGLPDAGAKLSRLLHDNPGWAEGQARLAGLRWEQGEGEAALSGFAQGVRAEPANGRLWNAYIRTLAACGLHLAAADAAAAARAAGFRDAGLMLLEAENAGAAGDRDRVERLLAAIPPGAPGRTMAAARQRLRTGEPVAASVLLDELRVAQPWDVSAWALTEIAWRLLDDTRADWLAAPELVATRTLELDQAALDRLAGLLRGLHLARHHPAGQSVRGGTQTRGRLFDRAEPEIAALKAALQRAVDSYMGALPPADPAHPLLRRRDERVRVDGGWSVRLAPGGRHDSHIHRAGLLSSACYIALPPLDAASQEGWLELGRPPTDLGLALSPRAVIEPQVGGLVLFPSYLYHGTRPFAAGERLSVAFDAA